MKDIIFYHRAYRRLSIEGKYIFPKFLFLVVPLLMAILFLYPQITFFMNCFAKSLLLSSFPFDDIKILEKPYMLSNIYILSIIGKHPTPLLSFLLFLFSIATIFFIPKVRVFRPMVAWIIFISSINLISSIFFMLTPSIFPYDMENFSELYVKTEVAIWFFVPVVMGITLLLLPSSIISMFSIAVLTLLYSIVFGILRYIVFLYVLKMFSYIFMPLLFFAFGHFMDFTYMVGIYALYSSVIARKMNNRVEVGAWKWS